MKRWISLLLALALGLGAAVQVAAEAEVAAEGGAAADERLKAVTEAVKNTLDLDTEDYTDFQGDVSEEPLGNVWNLRWTGLDRSLTVNALEDGTVVGLWYNDNMDEATYYRPGLPRFPKIDTAKAKAAAEAFLALVLDDATETAEWSETPSEGYLNMRNCGFSGSIRLNGLPAPLTFHVTVRGSDYAIMSFHRDAPAQQYVGNVPSPVPSVSKESAAEKLKTVLNLELIYVTDGAGSEVPVPMNNTVSANGGKGAEKIAAILRYVPRDQEMRYVDARTGELVDLSDQYGFSRGSAAPAPAAEESADMDAGNSKQRSLTATELSGIAKMKGVLDSAALDRHIRQESAYHLDGFTVSRASYQLIAAKKDSGEEDRVLCHVVYTDRKTADSGAEKDVSAWPVPEYSEKYFNVDARTGVVLSMSASGRWDKDRKPSLSQERAKGLAEAFLSRFTAHAGEMAIYDTEDATKEGAPFYSFTFARKHGAYFFPQDSCTVQIDCENGAVCGVTEFTWSDAAFEDDSGIITPEEALDRWMDTYDTVLAYRTASKELDGSSAAEARIIRMGYTRFQTLFLCYGLEQAKYCTGINAKSGEPAVYDRQEGEISYTDTAGHPAEGEISRLAAFRVGYAAEQFRPDQRMTQWDMVCLLASTQGYQLDPDTAGEDERDSAYAVVYSMDALKRTERNEQALLTRNSAVRLLLNAAGYRETAGIPGIFTCSYADKDAIPGQDMGYAALAQGLGLVSGTYNATGPVSRAEGAVMLCRLMDH